MYVHETNLNTWCSKILTSALLLSVRHWCGATPCFVFRLKDDNGINVSFVVIFKNTAFMKIEVTNPLFVILLEIYKTSVLIYMRTCGCCSVFYC
jgi:hypothetical protein